MTAKSKTKNTTKGLTLKDVHVAFRRDITIACDVSKFGWRILIYKPKTDLYELSYSKYYGVLAKKIDTINIKDVNEAIQKYNDIVNKK